MKYLKIFEDFELDKDGNWELFENPSNIKLDPFNLGPFGYGGTKMITTDKVFKGNENIQLFFHNASAYFSMVQDGFCGKVEIEDFFDKRKDYLDFSHTDEESLSDIVIMFEFKYIQWWLKDEKIRTIDLKVEIPIYVKDDEIFTNEHAEVEFGKSYPIFSSEEECNKFKEKVFPVLRKCKGFQRQFGEFLEYSSPEEWKKVMKMLNSIKLY